MSELGGAGHQGKSLNRSRRRPTRGSTQRDLIFTCGILPAMNLLRGHRLDDLTAAMSP